MEILGIGMPELIFIFIIAILIMGPKDMQKAGKTIGKWLRSLVMSDSWKTMQQTSREIRTLPNRLMREASVEFEQVNQIGKDLTNPQAASDAKYSNLANSQQILATPNADKFLQPAEEPKDNESDPEQNA